MTAQPATIQVQYVNQPREAHWSHGNVKDVNKVLWSVKKEYLPYFTQGETCEILWEQTGKYPEIIGKGGVPFPSQQPPRQPGSAVQPQTAAQVWKAPLAPKPAPEAPPILSNTLAHAIAAGLIKHPHDLEEWARWVKQAVQSYDEGIVGHSPGHAARSDVDSQYGGDHPDGTLSDQFPPGYAG